MQAEKKLMIDALGKVLKRMHYPLEVTYPLSLRHIEEMMAERGVFVDHATVHWWSIKILPSGHPNQRRN